MLDRAGLDTVYVDDEFANAGVAGLPIAHAATTERDAAA
jgi:hypothetical protein